MWHPKSATHGRPGAPAETVLRLLVLKHVRNWSYQVLEREVRANLVYRDFARVGGGKVPDAKTMRAEPRPRHRSPPSRSTLGMDLERRKVRWNDSALAVPRAGRRPVIRHWLRSLDHVRLNLLACGPEWLWAAAVGPQR